jgi:hypothetical protein
MTTSKSNKSKRTFTIRKNDCKYRTNQLSQDDFDEMDNYTSNDWDGFLSNSQDYYRVN